MTRRRRIGTHEVWNGRALRAAAARRRLLRQRRWWSGHGAVDGPFGGRRVQRERRVAALRAWRVELNSAVAGRQRRGQCGRRGGALHRRRLAQPVRPCCARELSLAIVGGRGRAPDDLSAARSMPTLPRRSDEIDAAPRAHAEIEAAVPNRFAQRSVSASPTKERQPRSHRSGNRRSGPRARDAGAAGRGRAWRG